MADKGFWGTVGEAFTDRIKKFLTPEKSEVELAALQKAKEVEAMQKAENAVKAFEAAPDDKWKAVNDATARYKS
jgi:hypothetical protein